MTTKNSILLIIKQNEGIDYNALLAKISSNYSSINSSRAALSRALKDLTAFGLVKKQGKSFFLTDKGSAEISGEIKNKLLLKLNQLFRSPRNVDEINQIVESLQTMIERSKQDTDLLKAAKGSADFSLSDVEELNKKLKKRIKQLSYLSRVLGHQLDSLKELDFFDSKSVEFSEKNLEKVFSAFSSRKAREIFLESRDVEFLKSLGLPQGFKAEKGGFFLLPQELGEVKPTALKHFLNNSSSSFSLFSGSLESCFGFPSIRLRGPAKEIEKIVGEAGLK